MVNWLSELGYDHRIADKPDNVYSTAIFFKKDRFSCKDSKEVYYDYERKGCLLYVHLQYDESELVFAETHLKAMPKNKHIRLKETNQLVS